MARYQSIFDRVGLLISANVNALLDKALNTNSIAVFDEYVNRNFHSLFLRPISPYGFAVRSRKKTGYEIDRFLDFYKSGLEHVIEINRGGYYLVEVYTKLLLTKMLTPFGTGYVDLQSPAGAARSGSPVSIPPPSARPAW